MRTLLFLSRVAVLLNVLFLVFLAGNLGYLPVMNTYLSGFIITSGMIAILVNLALLPVVLFASLQRRKVVIPLWILAFNLFCFALQIVFYFFT